MTGMSHAVLTMVPMSTSHLPEVTFPQGECGLVSSQTASNVLVLFEDRDLEPVVVRLVEQLRLASHHVRLLHISVPMSPLLAEVAILADRAAEAAIARADIILTSRARLGPDDLHDAAPTIEAGLALRVLCAKNSLGPLRDIRVDPQVGAAVDALGSQVLAHAGAAQFLAMLSGSQALGEMVDLAARLLWARQHSATRTLLQVIANLESAARPHRVDEPEPAPRWREICDGYGALTDLTERGSGEPSTTEQRLASAAAGLLEAADHYLAHEDSRRAALVASAALWILFHQELHDSAPTSPLVADSSSWLRPFTESRVGGLLTAGLRPARASISVRRAPLVLTGSYPRFAAPVVDALRDDARLTVSTLDLSKVDKPFKRMAVEPWLVEVRLQASLGERASFPALEQHLSAADTVLADWADAGAMLASLLAPAETALTVRAHSVDALRCWLHLIDWSAVDQLICVGPHIQDLIKTQLGERLIHVRQTVLPNIVQLRRFDHPRQEETDYTLAMVVWGRAVKDPLWTVELLARLRQRDPRWRLLLIGHPFPDVLPPTGRAYARRFAQRVQEADVQPAIEYVRYTEHLAPVLARAGWVVSSSVRESWGVGPMEAVAAGAVPIIRNWPLFARWGGAHRIYPSDWVVDSLEEAEWRISRIMAADRRSAVSLAARQLLADLIDPEAAAVNYRRALTTAATLPGEPTE